MNAARTLVCFAMPQEANPLRKILRQGSVRVVVTGMGRANTQRLLLAAFTEATPALVLTCGFAGALDPGLQLNTVLFETADPDLAVRLQEAGAHAARFHCADQMISTAAQKAVLRRDTGADAVEMESSHVHRLCADRGIRCATVRVISDTADEDMPLDFNALTTPEMRMDFRKLAWALAKRPLRIVGLVRLQRQISTAARSLGAVLGTMLEHESRT
ncbi:MAG: adenosylhomocysteine nucleosidase [Verrucomicrobiota bacterium]|jgi:nucleoside phosphorylase